VRVCFIVHTLLHYWELLTDASNSFWHWRYNSLKIHTYLISHSLSLPLPLLVFSLTYSVSLSSSLLVFSSFQSLPFTPCLSIHFLSLLDLLLVSVFLVCVCVCVCVFMSVCFNVLNWSCIRCIRSFFPSPLSRSITIPFFFSLSFLSISLLEVILMNLVVH